MNAKQLQNDKLQIINWIAKLEDYSMLEKIKSLMIASNSSYALTDDHQEILNNQVNEDKTNYSDADKVLIDLRTKKMLDTRLADHKKNPNNIVDFDDLLDDLESQI